MAEVYWDMEEKVLNQGFDYAYDKRLYDFLEQEDPAKIKEHLRAAETSQRKSVRFLENHDEARAAAVFENGRHQAAALITYLSPGLRFFHQGQLEGFRTKISVHLCRGPQESGDPTLTKFYSHLLHCLKINVFHQGSWQLLSPQPAWENNSSHEACIAYAWTGEPKERILVVVNYADQPGQCALVLPFEELVGKQVFLKDDFGGTEYERPGDELISSGLYLDLPAWGIHLFKLCILEI